MAQTPAEFLREVLLAVAQRAEHQARPKIPSATLRAALYTRLEEATQGMVAKLSIPHYWAVYVHDGRPAISKDNGFLVFFRDLKDDPRVENGFPERASQIRKLSRDQFRAGLALNRDHLASGGDPLESPMIVVKRVGPVDGAFFFTAGMAGFLTQTAGPLIVRSFDEYVQRLIDGGLHEKATIKLNIG